jgi:hypothetical protein
LFGSFYKGLFWLGEEGIRVLFCGPNGIIVSLESEIFVIFCWTMSWQHRNFVEMDSKKKTGDVRNPCV